MSFAEIWQLLTKDATGLSVLVAAAALLASVLSAVVSAWAAREARVMRQAQTEGDVIAYLEQSSQVFQAADLVIRNVGAGVAYEVSVETAGGWMVDASPEAPPRYLANVGFVRHGLPLLAPGQMVRTFIGMATEVMSRPVRHFEVTVTFRPTEGAAPVRRTFDIDFRSLDDTEQVGVPPPVAIADALTTLSHHMRSAVSAGYLRVDVRTSGDRKREREAVLRLRAEREEQRTRAQHAPTSPPIPASDAPRENAPDHNGCRSPSPSCDLATG